MFNLYILGCGSATPTRRHQPSSQVIDYRGNLMMIDCGEGAQVGMRRAGLKFSRLGHIFISHLHGDHLFGLPGLLSTMDLHEKGGKVVIHIFKEGIKVLKPLIDYFCRETSFEIVWEEVSPEGHQIVFENDSLIVETFPLYHRVPCVGYKFTEKPKARHLRGDMIKYLGIPIKALASIKAGADWTREDTGEVIPNERLTTPADRSFSYAYCSDTVAEQRVADAVKGVDVLYHEATYAEADAEKARPRGHSTAADAGRIARSAGAGRLVIGHYSKRYHDEEVLRAEAAAECPGIEVIAADEGLKIKIDQ